MVTMIDYQDGRKYKMLHTKYVTFFILRHIEDLKPFTFCMAKLLDLAPKIRQQKNC